MHLCVLSFKKYGKSYDFDENRHNFSVELYMLLCLLDPQLAEIGEHINSEIIDPLP